MPCIDAFPDRYTPERLDYAFDWSAELEAGEAIASATVTMEDGDLSVSDIATNGSVVAFWLSGGSPVYQRIACIVTTDHSPPRVYEVQATIACYT